MNATPVYPARAPVNHGDDDTDEQKSGVHPSAKLDDEASETTACGCASEHRDHDRDQERSLHVRTQFLRRIAHDIASPTGVAMTVLEEIAAESDRPDLVTMARRGLRRLLRLSEQLALASALEAGDVVPDPVTEDIGALTKEALENAVAIDGRRDIVTSCRVPEARVLVDVDRRLVLSLLRETIGNALKLATSRVSVDVELVGGARAPYESAEQPITPVTDEAALPGTRLSNDAKVEIRIQDDGSGFSEENLAALGERFTSRSCTRGLGLSLSMAKEILAAHGGELRVETSTLPLSRRKTRGAAVVISLPAL